MPAHERGCHGWERTGYGMRWRVICYLVESVFSIITRQAIRRASFTSVRQVTDAIRTFIDAWNDRCVPCIWTKTVEDILAVANRKANSETDH